MPKEFIFEVVEILFPVSPALQRLKPEGCCRSDVRLAYRVRPSFQNKHQETTPNPQNMEKFYFAEKEADLVKVMTVSRVTHLAAAGLGLEPCLLVLCSVILPLISEYQLSSLLLRRHNFCKRFQNKLQDWECAK